MRVSLGVAALLFAEHRLWWALHVQASIACLQLIGFVRVLSDRTKTRGGLGGLVWWKELRVVHMACYGAFVVLALSNVSWAGRLLVSDAALGAAGWFVVRPYALNMLC